MNQEYESCLTDLGIKKVKDNAGSLFEETTRSPSLHCYISSFIAMDHANQPDISVQEITIYGYGSPLGHVIKIIKKTFCSTVSHELDKNSDL